MLRRRWYLPLLCGGFWLLGMVAAVQAEPVSPRQYWGLAERLEKSKSAVMVKFLSSRDGEKDGVRDTTYRVLRVLKDPRKGLIAGKILVVPGALQAEAGEWSLLLEYDVKDSQDEEPVWMEGYPITESCLQYINHAPPRAALPARRMEYYFRFLGHSEKPIADDAYWVFSQECGNELIPFSKKLSPEKLRRLVFEENAVARREQLDLFAMMLGWCGTEADAVRLEALIRKPPQSENDCRLEMRGLMVAHLLLTRSEGLKVVEEVLSRSQGTTSAATVSKLAAMESLKFMADLGEGRISAPRLRETMRLAMQHPDVEDLAIKHFADWKVWEMQDELFQRYHQAGTQRPVKSEIITFLWASSRDVPPAQAAHPPRHVVHGREYLEKLRKQDPKFVSDCEKHLLDDEELLKKVGSRKSDANVAERKVDGKSN